MKPREAVSTALETQAVISKPRPNPRIRRFLITVHSQQHYHDSQTPEASLTYRDRLQLRYCDHSARATFI